MQNVRFKSASWMSELQEIHLNHGNKVYNLTIYKTWNEQSLTVNIYVNFSFIIDKEEYSL